MSYLFGQTESTDSLQWKYKEHAQVWLINHLKWLNLLLMQMSPHAQKLNAIASFSLEILF